MGVQQWNVVRACAGLPRARHAGCHGHDDGEAHDAEHDIGHDAREGPDGVVRRHVVERLGDRRNDGVACSITWHTLRPSVE